MSGPVEGAILGAVFGELLKLILDPVKRVAGFHDELKQLETTLKGIEPVIIKITESSNVLDIGEAYTQELTGYLEKGKELVGKCLKIKSWDVIKKSTHATKLISLNKDLLLFFQTKTPANLVSISLLTVDAIRDLGDKLDRLLSTVTSRVVGFAGSCSVPGLPEFTVGLSQRLACVKPMLLEDTTRLLLLTGHGGFGKTTLAKKLGHDTEIKDKFGDNILYVTVSSDNSLKSIAKTIFQHYRINEFDFKTEEDAKNQIENLIRQKGSDGMLLILDDVWPKSESVIQHLKFQINGYKILVTSRSLTASGFDRTHDVNKLNHEDAKALFCHWASPSVENKPIDLVNKMVDFCKGIPLVLTVVGSSLRDKPEVRWESTLKKWSEGQSILQSHKDLLDCLQTSIDALEELHKNCFLDLGLFPKDDQIVGSVLMDMWVELYVLDDDGMDASDNLHELKSRNLINVVPNRKNNGEREGHCSRYHVTQHDVLKELSVHLSEQDPEAKRQRLFVEIHSNTFPEWWTREPVDARILSISTDEGFGSGWTDLNAPNVEVLILNIRSKNFTLPQFINRMSQLKVLIITGYGDYPTQLDNLQILASLSKLSRIRFEHVSVPSSVQVIFTKETLTKLTFVMCKFGNALDISTTTTTTTYPYMHLILKTVKRLTSLMSKNGNDSTTEYPFMLENLKHLEFDLCYDLKELPAGLCSCISLQKLIIINCQELHSLPKELGNLSDLEILRLHCCTNLKELPETIGSLGKLHSLDISDCLLIPVLPKQIGDLSSLKDINISGCEKLDELPLSMTRLKKLKKVKCDEERSYLWKKISSDDDKIHIVEHDMLGNLKDICR